MKIEIGAYDAERRTVAATFADQGITHRRDVNACHAPDGSYDAAATAARIESVAAGVAVKIAAGAIVNPPPTPDPAAPIGADEA